MSATSGPGRTAGTGLVSLVGAGPGDPELLTVRAVRRLREAVGTKADLLFGTHGQMTAAGAIRLAKQLGPGKTIVTILADSGNRYQSKLFNPEFLREKGLPVPDWLEEHAAGVPQVFEEVPA